jgi:hypothetical protein
LANLDADAREPERLEFLGNALVAAVGRFSQAAVELDEGGQMLCVRQPATAGAGAEASGGLARNAAEHDVLVLAVAVRLGPGAAEKDDVPARMGERRRWDRHVEGLVLAQAAKITQIAYAIKMRDCPSL